MAGRKITIGVMGSSAAGSDTETIKALAAELAAAIAESGCVLITGETTGIPACVIESMRCAGGLSVGISPALCEEDRLANWPDATTYSDVVIYTGFGLKGRNVVNVRASDIVIIFGGSIGTLNEFTIAYDEGKIIGVVRSSGGIADELEPLLSRIAKKTRGAVFYEASPRRLVDICLKEYRRRAKPARPA